MYLITLTYTRAKIITLKLGLEPGLDVPVKRTVGCFPRWLYSFPSRFRVNFRVRYRVRFIVRFKVMFRVRFRLRSRVRFRVRFRVRLRVRVRFIISQSD